MTPCLVDSTRISDLTVGDLQWIGWSFIVGALAISLVVALVNFAWDRWHRG